MEQLYTTGEAAEILGVTTKTLQTWDKDEEFCPDHMSGKDRRYSKELLEKRLGKTIKEATDPVLALRKHDIISLLMAAQILRTWDFNAALGNTMWEKYSDLFVMLNRISMKMYRNNETCPANFLVAPPGRTAPTRSEPNPKQTSPRGR